MWAKTSCFAALALALVLLAGCGGSSKSSSTNGVGSENPGASAYPAQYKTAFFKAKSCGEPNGYSTSSCECQIKYVEAHVPYKWLEEGSSEHAKAEEAMNEAPSHCSSEHTSSEEASHNSATEAQSKEQELYAQKQKEDEPEEAQLQKDREKVEYEDGG
jgi:hypothetical protein